MKKLLLLFMAVSSLHAQVLREGLQRTIGTNTITGTQAQVPFQVALLADLKAITVSSVANAQVVAILGYASMIDGGGGQFTYNSSSTATPNDTTVVQPTTGAGRWLRISYIGLTTAVGGTSGQILYNNAGLQGGFTASGDATVNTGTGAVTIAANAVTNAKAAQMATHTIKGNSTSGTANAADLTAAQAKTLLAIANTDVAGLGTMSTQAASAVAITGGTMASVAITGGTITGLSAPSASSDAATKGYADSISAGITPRTAVRLATTANITLSGVQTIDGLTANAADRVLVKNQTLPAQNGIYDVAAGAWSRSSDSDTAGELLVRYYYFVSSGSAQGSTGWFIQTAPTVLNTDPVVFGQFSGNQSYSAGTNMSLTGNVFSVPSYNGTVGAITPASGMFTTVGISGNLTYNGAINGGLNATDGTVTGVFYLSGASGHSLVVGTQSNHPTIIFSNNAAVGTFSSTGLAVAGNLSATGSITGSSVATGGATARTLADRFATVYNVKDYGALGDGSTNDTAAIVLAKNAAVAGAGSLYFPKGTYMTDTLVISGASGLSVTGDGMGVSILKVRAAGHTMTVSASSRVSVHHLTFDGSSTTRTAGAQAVVFDAVQSSFSYNEITNSGEYAFFAGSAATQIYNLNVSHNYVHACYADGINFQYVTRSLIENNIVDGSDDDCIALGYNGSGASSFITVSGNYCRARADLGTNWGRGILAERVSDCLIEGNYIDTIKQTGIYVNNAGGTRPTRISVIGNTVKNAATASGHGICIYGSTDCSIMDNVVQNPASGNCIELADWQNLTISGGTLAQTANIFTRGIHCDESAGWAASWDRLKISSVTINMLGASTGESIYLSPDASVTMNTLLINAVTSDQVPAGNYIFLATARAGTLAKIVNNTKLQAGNTISPASSTGVVTVTNNN